MSGVPILIFQNMKARFLCQAVVAKPCHSQSFGGVLRLSLTAKSSLSFVPKYQNRNTGIID
jgi:hypothetical protein